MADAISNTSPLLYLYRIDAIVWLEHMFGEVWIPNAVALEAAEASTRGSVSSTAAAAGSSRAMRRATIEAEVGTPS